MIAIIDYGAGNIRSVEKALMHIGCEVEVTQDPSILMKADGAVLPGVGRLATPCTSCAGEVWKRRLKRSSPPASRFWGFV